MMSCDIFGHVSINLFMEQVANGYITSAADSELADGALSEIKLQLPIN